MNATRGGWLFAFVAVSAGLGCAVGTNDSFSSGPAPLAGGGGAGGGGGQTQSEGGAAEEGATAGQFMNLGGDASQPGCDATAGQDKDEDGFSIVQGDCNDCDANVNPGAIEVIPEDDGSGGAGGYVAADEDCDGTADNVATACDDDIAINASDPMDGARSIELCKSATSDQDWGVLSATWVRANGTPATVNYHMGVLDGFGPNVSARHGVRMLGLSSGAARDTADAGYCAHSCSLNGAGTPPAGYPQDVPGCTGGANINDDVGLELSIRAPTNATGYKFDFKFYSNEFPEWVCTTYNDQFIALVNPAPMGSTNGNISFDSLSNPVSVNIAFFDVCNGCVAGTAELEGTDFLGDEGATSWLQTTAPITGGDTFSIRYATWDTGDTAYDSTTLIDNFQWIATGGTVIVGTEPIPE